MQRFDPDNLSALKQHLHECDECRAAYAAYVSSATHPASYGDRPARLLSWSPADARRRRFLDAATRQGLTFSDEALTVDIHSASAPIDGDRYHDVPMRSWRWAAAVAALAIGLGATWLVIPRRVAPDLSASVAQLERENAALRVQLDQRTAALARSEAVIETARSTELEQAHASLRAADTRIAALDVSLLEASRKRDALETEMTRATADSDALRARVRETDERIATLQAERDKLVDERAADATFMAMQSVRIDRLSEQMRDRDQTLARQQELLGADRDIRDLMGARNLHVIDVFDVDGRGKTRRSFGRAFYTEGKSLIFYAYDLAGRETMRTSFQAWGHRTADEGSTQSLGILYSDDKAQNRWILKFDDPKVLAQIDAVFVTVEPPGGSTRPSGHKLLYAYLRNSPNHP